MTNGHAGGSNMRSVGTQPFSKRETIPHRAVASNCAPPGRESRIDVSLLDLSPQSMIEPNKERRELVPWLQQEDRGQRIEDIVRKSGRLPFRQVVCDLLTARRIPLTEGAGGLASRQPSWRVRLCVRKANQSPHRISSVGNDDGRPREDPSSSLRSGKSCERRRNLLKGLCVDCHSSLSMHRTR